MSVSRTGSGVWRTRGGSRTWSSARPSYPVGGWHITRCRARVPPRRACAITERPGGRNVMQSPDGAFSGQQARGDIRGRTLRSRSAVHRHVLAPGSIDHAQPIEVLVEHKLLSDTLSLTITTTGGRIRCCTIILLRPTGEVRCGGTDARPCMLTQAVDRRRIANDRRSRGRLCTSYTTAQQKVCDGGAYAPSQGCARCHRCNVGFGQPDSSLGVV